MLYCAIKDVANLVRGVTYKKDQASKEPFKGSISILRANNIVEGRIDFSDLVFVPATLASDEQHLAAGDIVITMSSGSKNHVGKVALYKASMEMAFGAFCAKLSPIDVLPEYLLYILRSNSFRKHIEQLSKGTNINNIKADHILDYMIPVPPLDEQERIVSRIEELFSQLDSGVETLRKTKQQLAVYRQAVITEAFPLENNNPYVCLSDIAQIIGGITKGRDLSGKETIELPYLRVANVQNGYLDLSEIKTIILRVDEKERYLLKPGDVLYTEGGDRDKLGRGTVWRGEIKDCVHQNHIFKARIDQSKALPEYVAFWSMSTPARNYFYQKGKQSVNLASINKTVLSALSLPIPALEKQREIINHIESRLSVCNSIEQTVDTALQQAEAMRQSILKQAFENNI